MDFCWLIMYCIKYFVIIYDLEEYLILEIYWLMVRKIVGYSYLIVLLDFSVFFNVVIMLFVGIVVFIGWNVNKKIRKFFLDLYILF